MGKTANAKLKIIEALNTRPRQTVKMLERALPLVKNGTVYCAIEELMFEQKIWRQKVGNKHIYSPGKRPPIL